MDNDLLLWLSFILQFYFNQKSKAQGCGPTQLPKAQILIPWAGSPWWTHMELI